MFRHLRDARALRKGEGIIEAGFTLIELLVVIVVLGILAATVVFALSGVSGQSAEAACNSDAKTIEVAVQAYINSPDNSTNAPPASVGALVTAPFSKNAPTTPGDTFLAGVPTNKAYAVTLVPVTGKAPQVWVKPSGGTNAQYDTGTNPCSSVN
jgi:prepilin-type N-terminal cleavage/methylation domain-containing protein